MAKDIAIIYKNGLFSGDFEYNRTGDYTREKGLTTAVLLSLFLDKRADSDDELINKNERRGWWGDQVSFYDNDQIGSKLWLLDRSKTDNQTLEKAKEYTIDSLQWMIDDEVAAQVNVTAERQGDAWNSRLAMRVEILKVNGNIEVFKFNDLWTAQFEKE